MDLAEALGLSPADAAEIELRSELNEQLIRIVHKLGLTHAQVAKLAAMSRTRVTAILNRHTHGVTTDRLVHLLAALGYRTRVKVVPARPAA